MVERTQEKYLEGVEIEGKLFWQSVWRRKQLLVSVVLVYQYKKKLKNFSYENKH